MINLKHIKNSIVFYIKKYGVFRTIKKCIKVFLRKLLRFLKGKPDVNYGFYPDWLKANQISEEELEKQKNREFGISPKISVIVPMYNTKEKFFKELVDSMINQTYSNWELCLADGSPEQNEKLKEYVEKDERIKYKFLNGNKGIAGNTNAAIEMVTGEYIALLDHDDILPPYSLYEVVNYINK